MRRQQIIDRLGIELTLELPRVQREEQMEFPLVRVANLDLVGNPPQKRFVDQVPRFEIRREDA